MPLDQRSAPTFRADFAETQKRRRDFRSQDRIAAHYLLEKQLAHRLANSAPFERGRLYTEVYDALFAALPDHPQRTADRSSSSRVMKQNLRYIGDYLNPLVTFLEIGCGDAQLSFAVAPRVGQVVGLDVTNALIPRSGAPANFRFLKTERVNIDLGDGTVDVAYSNQLMEHLHPEDALDQLSEVVRVLKPGGMYWCTTPNRLTGPHDVSKYFDEVATGLHLREYDHMSLRQIFQEAGFRRVRFFIATRGVKLPLPFFVARMASSGLELMPRLTKNRLVTRLMDLNIVGLK